MATPNMNLPLPVPTSTLGPQWATEINQGLNILDVHDHSPGRGLPITPASIDMNNDLDFKNRAQDNVGVVRLQNRSSALASAAPNVRAIYSVNGDLFYNDGSGNQIQLTIGGGAAASPVLTADRAVITNSSGILTVSSTTSTQIANAPKAFLSPGQTFNLGCSYSAGTFTIHAADGSPLSSTNLAYVCVRSTTIGQNVLIPITANQTFNDDANASSDIVGQNWATKTGVAWSHDRPFFLYFINIDNSSGVFGITPNPIYTKSPVTAEIGYKGNPTALPRDSHMWCLTSTDVTSTAAEKPCVRIGGIRMRKSTSDDWTVQTLTDTDGFNEEPYNGAQFLWAAGQALSTAAGRYFNSVNSPSWATPANIVAKYMLDIVTGEVRVVFHTNLAGSCTNGANSSSCILLLPLAVGNFDSEHPPFSLSLGFSQVGGSAISVPTANSSASTSFNVSIAVIDGTSWNGITNDEFGNTSCDLYFDFKYRCFVKNFS